MNKLKLYLQAEILYKNMRQAYDGLGSRADPAIRQKVEEFLDLHWAYHHRRVERRWFAAISSIYRLIQESDTLLGNLSLKVGAVQKLADKKQTIEGLKKLKKKLTRLGRACARARNRSYRRACLYQAYYNRARNYRELKSEVA